MRPFRSFLLLLAVLAILTGLSYLFPGRDLFPSFADLIPAYSEPDLPEHQPAVPRPSVSAIAITDSLVRARVPFDTLLKAGGQVRILYYGDSQIEGDRITSRLRELLRKEQGGSGPGLFLPVMPMMYTRSYWLRSSANWQRYNFLSWRKGETGHNDLGPFMSYCRYLPPGQVSQAQVKAWLTVRPSPSADSSASEYERLRILYRLSQGSVKYSVSGEGAELYSGILETGQEIREITCDLGNTRTVTISFSGRVSPDIYGISIESDSGVVVDNIPQRGSAGLEFTMVGRDNLKQAFDILRPDLIVIHYGLNVVKNVKDDYAFYRKGLERQVRLIREIAPGIPVLLVSVSDMAEASGDSIKPYGNIGAIVATQKEAAANTGSFFWDCYSAMGGEGSAIAWAAAKEPLVQDDYVHFTTRGSDSIASMLVHDLFIRDTLRQYVHISYAPETKSGDLQAARETQGPAEASSKLPAVARQALSVISRYDPEKPFIFTTPSFWLFMLVALLVYSLVYRRRIARNSYLFLISLFFYYKTGGLFLLLLILVTVTDYLAAILIHWSDRRNAKRIFLLLSIISNLGMLAYFKYSVFIVSTVNDIFGSSFLVYDYLAELSNTLLGTSFSIDSIILPVGISFFTFQSLSYTIDVYRGKLEPVRNIIDFGFYVSFFPQLVAGPIVRASEFMPQLHSGFALTEREAAHALFLISKGLVKKIVISDFIALNLIDRVFASPASFSGFENLVAVYGYGLQIYCDFSGYTDIAIGIALFFGFRLPINFNSPYKAADIADFWRRWHISLSRWLRDYLYIPLGGNRQGWFRTGMNLMITMTLGGLWHGASLRFILWGALHGAALALTKAFNHFFGDGYRRNRVLRAFAVFLTFNFVSFSWIFFRAPDFESIRTMAGQIVSGFAPGSWPEVLKAYSNILLLTAAGYFIHLLPETVKEGYRGLFIKIPLAGQVIMLLLLAVVLWQMRSTGAVPFIYFRF